MSIDSLQVASAALAVASPAVAFFVLLFAAALGRKPSERIVGGLARAAFGLCAIFALTAAGIHVATNAAPRHVALVPWFGLDSYAFELGIGIDGLSLTFLALVGLLSALVGSVSHRYLHRENGYRRFFLLLSLFSSSMALLVMADTLDLLFVGWELVGLTSALLVAFYQERRSPARHGLVAFVVYRICDVGLLTSVVFLHHFTGRGQLPVGGIAPSISAGASTLLGLLLLWGSL
ncbi:MAG: proton-conducting membrane transporter, partial [Polyangiaceae bacterium]|nr:proton-conducting membrane transporter [Polyangiaceae bacterium]